MEFVVVLEQDIVLRRRDLKLLMRQHLTPTSFEKYAPRVYRYQSRCSVLADYTMQNEQEKTFYLCPLLAASRSTVLRDAH